MATKTKLRIVDCSIIREEIDDIYEKSNQVILAKWSLLLAKHILEHIEIEYEAIDEIVDGFHVNEMWQSGEVGIHDVRQAGFRIHKLARESNNEIHKTTLRVVGQAVASGHMREHSMVASDYAIKVIGLLTSNDIQAITNERKWQLKQLKKLISQG